MKQFKASVQYNDMTGTAATDVSDQVMLKEWLEEKGHIVDGIIVGVRTWIGENHGKHRDPISVTFVVAKADGFDNVSEMLSQTAVPILEEIHIELDIADFLSLFKRFEIVISKKGLLENVSYIPKKPMIYSLVLAPLMLLDLLSVLIKKFKAIKFYTYKF